MRPWLPNKEIDEPAGTIAASFSLGDGTFGFEIDEEDQVDLECALIISIRLDLLVRQGSGHQELLGLQEANRALAAQ